MVWTWTLIDLTVSACDIAKELWDILKATCEGPSQVRESKNNLHVHHYKLFKMLHGEFSKDMYICFTEITNNLKCSEKTYTNEEMVRKVLQ